MSNKKKLKILFYLSFIIYMQKYKIICNAIFVQFPIKNIGIFPFEFIC